MARLMSELSHLRPNPPIRVMSARPPTALRVSTDRNSAVRPAEYREGHRGHRRGLSQTSPFSATPMVDSCYSGCRARRQRVLSTPNNAPKRDQRRRAHQLMPASTCPDYSRSLPRPLIIPGVMTLRTLADLREPLRHLPTGTKGKAAWKKLSRWLMMLPAGRRFC